MNCTVTVIGGANVDIGGRSAAALALHDSNPGFVTVRYGGVGRNIAHDLCLLGERVRLITTIGGDGFGVQLRESCLRLGMDLSHALILPEERSSSYLYVTDGNGDMLVGISDMDIVRRLTPAVLESALEAINDSDAVVVDANLEEETLAWIAAHCRVPLYADPVSAAKAKRLLPLLGRLRGLKPNLLEAAALTGETEPEAALDKLIACGVERVFLSLGSCGIRAAEGEERVALPCEPLPVVNTNGAGDAALAALVWADRRGRDLTACTRAALHAGAVTSACEETNHPELAKQMESFL